MTQLNDTTCIYWIMTSLGAVWVDRWYSNYSHQWYYTSMRRNHRTILCGIMDDFGDLVEVVSNLKRINHHE